MLCVCLRAQREKRYPGSPSIVAVSTALTEGNGPSSNPLKEVQMHRDEREDETKKRGGRGGTERPHPTPH